jgi:hypothetical protein
MNIERLINELAKGVAKTVLKKEEESGDKINLKDMGSGDILQIILKCLVKDRAYNKAENFLFKEIIKNKSEENYQIALSFYNLLLEKNDKELEEGNFSREEIYQGLQDIKIMYKK